MTRPPLCHAQLNLYRNEIGNEGAAAIGDALKVNGSLTSLNVGYNMIPDDGATAIAEALKLNGSLKEVRSASAHARPSDLTARCVTHSWTSDSTTFGLRARRRSARRSK